MSYDDDNATVITPWSWASRAIELGNRQWKKRVLPVGDVEYQGRMLHFTRDYLGKLVDAFRDRAYDAVSFQLAPGDNKHTNDPERHRGQVTDLELAEDGLWMYLSPTERGEQVLRENPYLGVSARIVENYARSDGKFYPAAIQHVLGTLDPRIPGLGTWQPVGLSNDGELLIDLSGGSWQGEPGPSFELAASAVGARIGSQDVVSLADPFDDIDAVLADSLAAGQLAGFSAAFELSNAAEQVRLAEDAVLLAVRSEDRIANALGRISRGTFVPRGSYAREFASPDRGGVTGMATCGVADDLGYCMERFHAPGCGSAATPDITESLRPQLEMKALQPLLDADGQPWLDQYGSAMTATDFVESATGVRLGDANPYAIRPRRDLAQPQRPVVFGDDSADPGDPSRRQHGIPAHTARTAAALAAQASIATHAGKQAQHAAAVREHQRQAARYRGPRHMDYQDHASPARQAIELAQVGSTWNGSQPVYAATGAVGTDDEIWLA